jgi:hypothetical protein
LFSAPITAWAAGFGAAIIDLGDGSADGLQPVQQLNYGQQGAPLHMQSAQKLQFLQQTLLYQGLTPSKE